MRLKVKVRTNSGVILRIRQSASTSSSHVGSLADGSTTIVNGESKSGGWTWHKLEDGRGWICHQEPGVSFTYTIIQENLEATKPPAPAPSSSASTGTSAGIDNKVIEMLFNNVKKNANVDGSTRLFGSPFQFTEETDFRLNTEIKMGRKFLENIIGEAPIVYFLPGKPNYLPNSSEEERKALTGFFKDQKYEDPIAKKAMDQILGNKDDIRYFDFIPDFSEYIRYVNLLCRMAAIYIGIGDEKGPDGSTKYKYYNWANYKFYNDYKQDTENPSSLFNTSENKNDFYEEFFGVYNHIQFYVEPNTSFNESISNNTTHSMLEGVFESAESVVKELSFLSNAAALESVDSAMDTFSSGSSKISELLGAKVGDGFFTRLFGSASTVLSGANLTFPELWGDAEYNKSYTVNINLVSPYGDKESIYLNTIVPMLHVLALACPKQATANSYSSPFLVKCFSKGWFSCEMGIIESVSIEKGGSGECWTVDGLPSEIKMSITVKDLYTNLMISSTKQSALFFQNQGLIDFLAVSCGVDIAKPNLMIKLDAMFSAFLAKPMDFGSNIYREFIEAIRNQIEPLYKI